MISPASNYVASVIGGSGSEGSDNSGGGFLGQCIPQRCFSFWSNDHCFLSWNWFFLYFFQHHCQHSTWDPSKTPKTPQRASGCRAATRPGKAVEMNESKKIMICWIKSNLWLVLWLVTNLHHFLWGSSIIFCGDPPSISMGISIIFYGDPPSFSMGILHHFLWGSSIIFYGDLHHFLWGSSIIFYGDPPSFSMGILHHFLWGSPSFSMGILHHEWISFSRCLNVAEWYVPNYLPYSDTCKVSCL